MNYEKKLLTITKNKIKKIKRQIQIKIFNLATQNIYLVMFIKIIFLFNQTIISIDTYMKLIE